MDRGGPALSTVIVDASVIGPLFLLDEKPLPRLVESALIANPLSAPAHWPVETGNMLLVARRRGRIDDRAWHVAVERLREWQVRVSSPPDWRELAEILRLAEKNRLTAYESAYLHLAIISSATLASINDDLVAAARRMTVPVLTDE